MVGLIQILSPSLYCLSVLCEFPLSNALLSPSLDQQERTLPCRHHTTAFSVSLGALQAAVCECTSEQLYCCMLYTASTPFFLKF